jgi:hypothetical protein
MGKGLILLISIKDTNSLSCMAVRRCTQAFLCSKRCFSNGFSCRIPDPLLDKEETFQNGELKCWTSDRKQAREWAERRTVCNSNFVLIRSVSLHVCKISLNEDRVIVGKYNNYQPERLLSLRIFLGTESCLSTSVQSIVTESRAALGGWLQHACAITKERVRKLQKYSYTIQNTFGKYYEIIRP